MKNVLIISTTMRKGGNSEILANAFAKGAVESGNTVEIISLIDKTIAFCKGCLACQKTQKCIIDDDARIISEKVKVADVIVFATPVYYYEMSGQMKTLLDRLNPLFSSNYNFRDIYLIGTAADGDEAALNGTINGLEGWISCFEQTHLKGVVYGVGATNCGDINKNKASIESAYSMGRNV